MEAVSLLLQETSLKVDEEVAFCVGKGIINPLAYSLDRNVKICMVRTIDITAMRHLYSVSERK